MVEVNLYHNLKLSPPDLLNFIRRLCDFYMFELVHLIGFWKDECNLKTTFLIR